MKNLETLKKKLMELIETFEELDDKLLSGLRRLGFLSGQIGGDGARRSWRRGRGGGVVGLEIVVHGHGRGVENDIAVVVVAVVEVLVVETVFGVESCGLGFGLFHGGEGRRRCGVGVGIRRRRRRRRRRRVVVVGGGGCG